MKKIIKKIIPVFILFIVFISNSLRTPYVTHALSLSRSFLKNENSIPYIQQDSIVVNGGFETSNLDGWDSDGEASIADDGTDPITVNTLQKVAAGKFSGIIGDEIPWMGNEPQQSSLEQTIQLPPSLPSDSVLEFAYTVVANDPPDHPEGDKPRFKVLVEDLTTNKMLLDTEYLYTSQSSKDWYLGTRASNQIWNQPYYMLASDRWVFRPWKLVSISLAGLSGHQLNIHFEVRDCNYGAHAIYGFLDGVRVGMPSNMKLPDLQGDPQQAVYIEPPFWAPFLFWFEQWGLVWLCCLLPILLLFLLLWLLFRRKKQSQQIVTTINRDFKVKDDDQHNYLGKN